MAYTLATGSYKSPNGTLSLLIAGLVVTFFFSPLVAHATGEPPPTLPNAQLFTAQNLAPRVDQMTGALVQRVPLDIPPGRNGLTPDLALMYNSQDLQDGILGYGWSLSIPSIERLNKTGSERLYTDNYFTSSWGGELATTTTANEYRHRIEDGHFIKYTFENSIWKAYDKNGTRYLFGTTTQAQQFATTSTSTVSRWMLEEVRDTNDNFIRYVYTRDGNQIYPSQIIYTGSGSTDGIFTVDFTKATRPDIVTSYKNAYKVTTSYRITEIKASVSGSWVRKYTLSYGAGVNGVRSLLTSVQEAGQDDAAVQLTLPALTFAYASTTPGYESHTNQRIWNAARVVADADGNGLSDLNIFYEDFPLLGIVGSVEKNDYPSFSHSDSSVSEYWANDGLSWDPIYQPVERGVRFFDVSGDGKADVIRSYNVNTGSKNRTYYENQSSHDGGFSWVSKAASTSIPMFAYDWSSTVYSTGILGNVNGDGLVDYVISLPSLAGNMDANGAYLHAATSTSEWTLATSTFTPPATVPINPVSQSNSQLVDINGDGLDDWAQSGSGSIGFYINTGSGWCTSCGDGWYIATSSRHVNGWDRGIRFFDVNGDGLSDYVRAYTMPSYTNKIAGTTDIEIGTYNYVYLNTGSGWATSTLQMPEYIFIGILTTTQWGGRMEYNEPVDWNGDGIPDQSANTSTTTRPDILKQITYPASGSTNVEYRYSSQLGTNPNLAFPVLVVTAVGNGDNRGNTATTTYVYNNGEMYTTGNVLDRKFAGFETITENKGGTLTKSYYYQGNTASTTVGELTDSFPLIGKMYRKDVMASSTGAVFNRTFNNWNALYQGNNGRYFVHLATTTEQSFDGDSTHKDTAESFLYDSTGNVLSDTHWGEVVGNSDGTFVDTGTDMATTTTLYAASSSVNMQIPYAASTTNQAGTKVKETLNYFDGLALGSIAKGNRTKQENWISGSSYASTTRTYNSYGLVTQERDPRYNLTTYAYDSFNLYPATTTNALSQDTGYLYDYATGKVKQTLDPNTRRTQTIFDPVGRVKEIRQPDLTTPTTLVTKSTFTYNDTWPISVKRTDYLNAATSTYAYQYTDGLGRLYQTRKSAEGSDVAVQDFIYNNRGLLASSSLPYFGTGESSSAPTANSSLFLNYSYDPMDRTTTITNAVGTTTNSYDDWHTILTDPRGKRKDFYKDAYANLSQVVEHNAGTHATTTYAYDLNKQLTSITDAASNVRNFTYDGLGRRLTAQDLHASGDGTFGTFTYTYDEASNLTQQVDPKSQTVNFTYDALNRPLTENYTGAAGTEVEYAYDTGTDGIGRLFAATTTDSVTNYSYNPLGKVSRELRTLESRQYQTLFDYDRLGNIASTTYPDGSQVLNTYNVGGALEKIDRREPGGAVANIVANFDYTPHGQITYQAFANGVDTYKTYDENALYRLTSILTMVGGVGGFTLPEDIWGSLSSTSVDLLPAMAPSSTLPDESTSTQQEETLVVETGATSTAGVATSTVPAASEPTQEMRPQEILEPQEVSVVATSTATTTDVVIEAEMLPMSVDIHSLVTGKPAEERATIKGQEIAKLLSVPRTERGGYDVEVDAMNAIEGGIEVFARAWNKDGQIGFGKDGTVEIERFRIFNPPILVPDPTGTIERSYIDPDTGEKVIDLYREDPQEALLQTLEHIISIKKETFSAENIIEGKVGNTTSTFYPNANPESTSVDGYANRTGVNETLATIIAGGGTGAFDSGDPIRARLDASATPNQYSILRRGFMLFDTSPITDTDVITSATISVYGVTNDTALGASDLHIVASTPASNTAIVNSDYGNIGGTSFGSFSGDLTTGGYNNISLNSSGKAAVNVSGISKYGARLAFDLNGTGPTWVSSGTTQRAFYDVDETGTTKDPKLVVEHSAPNSAPTAPTSLETEAQSNPANISDSTPEFSAVYNDPDVGDLAINYRVQVATTSTFVSSYWDSGTTTMATTTAGARGPDISYAGSALASSTTYYWRIAFSDDSGTTGMWSTAASTFSLAASGGGGGGGDTQNISYTYDANGNITQISDMGSTPASRVAAYVYDDLNRLTSASTTAASSTPFLQTYTYDILGNLTNKSDVGTYTYANTGYANPHAVTDLASTTYAYDNNGNITNGGSWTYGWEYRNRLASAGNGAATSTYAYDNENQRVKKVTSGITTVYPNKYFNKAGATTTVQIFLPDGSLVATVEGNGTATTTSYVHPDHLGSTNVVTDADGAVVQTLDYYPYGSTRIDSGTDVSQREFIGQFHDEESGLDYLQARYYEGSRGQFLSQDPVFNEDPKRQNLMDPQTINSYSYASGNPITKKDPDGRFSIGVSFNGSLEGGFGAYSATYGSTNLNLVVNPATGQTYVVQSNTAAVNSGYMNNYQSAPDNGKAPLVLGLYGGAGFSINFSPKTINPNDIQGTENSVNVNVPFVSFGAQGEETGKPTYSVSPGVKGVASVSQYPVYTKVTSTYSVNQAVNNAATRVASYYQAAIASIQAQIGAIQSKINDLKSSGSSNKKN